MGILGQKHICRHIASKTNATIVVEDSLEPYWQSASFKRKIMQNFNDFWGSGAQKMGIFFIWACRCIYIEKMVICGIWAPILENNVLFFILSAPIVNSIQSKYYQNALVYLRTFLSRSICIWRVSRCVDIEKKLQFLVFWPLFWSKMFYFILSAP